MANIENQNESQVSGYNRNISEIKNSISEQRDEILRIARKATGLNFEYVSVDIVGKHNTAISIICSGTRDDLGFYGNYIRQVSYIMKSHSIDVEHDVRVWLSSGISYEHKNGGSNGVSDPEMVVYFNIQTLQFEVENV